MYDEQHFVHDAATAVFDGEAPGITVDDDGETSIDWDSVETTTIEDVPHAEAFDTTEFYTLPATVARPIPQPYAMGDDTVWLQKPREELKKAAWSLDNAAFTLGHPDTSMVKSVDDVRGFWRNPRYIDSLDNLDSTLHVPTDDEEATEYLDEHGDVSVGFYNRIARTDEYDGVVGEADAAGVDLDGYQTDMLFDHVASVELGRCSSENGCGITADGGERGHVFKGGQITNETDTDTVDSMEETTDQPSGIHAANDNWFAVGPDEHTKDSTDHPDDAMFPVGSCSSVSDAWKLRNHAEDLTIETSTLEARIRRAADAQDCPDPANGEEDSHDCGGGCGGDCCNNTHELDMELDLDDLEPSVALGKIVSEVDAEGLEAHVDDLQKRAEAADEAAEELDVDVEKVADKAAMLDERVEELSDEVDELTEPKRQDAAEAIAEATDRFGDTAEDVLDAHDGLDDLEETRDLVEDLSGDTSPTTANPETDSGSGEETEDIVGDRYVNEPWA